MKSAKEEIFFWRRPVNSGRSDKKNISYVYAIAAVIAWATAPVFFRIGVKSLDLSTAVFWFLLFGGGALTIVGLKNIKSVNFKRMFCYSLIIGVATAVHYMGYVNGIMSQDVSLSVAIAKTSPIFQLLFAFFLLGTIISRRTIIAMLFGLVGSIIVATNLQFQSFILTIPILTTLIAAIAWGFLLILLKKSEQNETLITGISLLWATLFVGLYGSTKQGLIFSQQISEWIWLIYLGIVPTAIAVALWTKSLKFIGNAKASKIIFFDYFGPIISVIFCFLLLRETISFVFLLGLILIVVGNILSAKDNLFKLLYKSFFNSKIRRDINLAD